MAASGLDEDAAQWLAALVGTGRARDQAITRLHGMLLRRRGGHPVTSRDLDDLAHQSADDAVLATTVKQGPVVPNGSFGVS
jgi:RNA polymerase sigma-70 factor, ECF subfamily